MRSYWTAPVPVSWHTPHIRRRMTKSPFYLIYVFEFGGETLSKKGKVGRILHLSSQVDDFSSLALNEQ